MDVVAALHWLRENLPAFGGDPERVTLLGHGTGAALANLVAVSSVAKELMRRVIMLSGSALSPWALQRDPLAVKRRVAERTGCHGDLLADDLAPCLRSQPLSTLMSVRTDPPRFLPGFAPFAVGTTQGAWAGPPVVPEGSGDPAEGMAGFSDRDLLFGLTTTESYLDLSAQDLEFGFNESRRDRILRTFVRNAYMYHLNEIFSTLKNEYTDWERPVQLPFNVRDATLEMLSDGHTAAPLLRVGFLHAQQGGRTYFMHFCQQSGERDFPQRAGSVRGEDVPYILGLPLVSMGGAGPFSPQQHNYSRQDAAVSKLLIRYISNFARNGDPNSGAGDPAPPFWDTYDAINQLYLELGSGGAQAETRSHYRGHKMSVWLNLIPQLHRPGGADLSMRHHHFQEEGAQFYDGSVRPQTLQRPVPPPTTEPPPTSTTESSVSNVATTSTTECPPNSTTLASSAPPRNSLPAGSGGGIGGGLLRRLASSHYQSYTAALSVTIAVGCCLLLLNVLIFAGIYRQRGGGARRAKEAEKKAAAAAMAASVSASTSEDKVPLGDMPLREFRSSPSKRCSPNVSGATASGIPDPPPPPKNQPPGSGILRQQGCMSTPATAKKRVQIQEISV